MGLEPIADARVRQSVRMLYMGSGLVFLATIALGVANVFTQDIPHAQVLAHFHAGTIGWVTLSVIATAVWAFTGQRQVSKAFGGSMLLLAGLGPVVVAGYVFAFGTAFSGEGPFWLLPAFGIPAALVILSGFLVTATQMRKQSTVTVPHLLLFGALLVASLGATMGVIWGLTYSTDAYPYPEGDGVDPVGAHAGPMDMYLALAFAAIVEILLVQGQAGRWRWPGMVQMVLGVASGFTASLALFFGIGPLVPAALLLFLAAFLFYFVRMGWRTFRVDPTEGGARPGLFFGGLGFPIYVGFFVYLVFAYFSQGEFPPHLLEVLFQHTTFVLMGTNLLLAIQAAYTGRPAAKDLLFAGIWILNIGLLLFFAGEAFAERKEGALIMAVGVLMALYAVWARFVEDGRTPPPPPAAM